MDKVIQIILDQIQQYNEIADTPIDTGAGEESVLFGSGSPLDSTGFVSLMLDIEQAVSDAFQKDIALVDARAMSQKNSPFRTVGSLAQYISDALKETENV